MKKILTIVLCFAVILSLSLSSSAQAQSVSKIKSLIARLEFGDAGSEIRSMIESLEVGEPVYYENLTIIPVYSSKIKDRANYVTLDEALANNWISIKELEGGSVPQVRITNNSRKYIYLMGGEILTGCKQDRIVGRDVLIKPRSKNILIPVYCVEQGRWDYESEKFYSKSNLGTYALRAEAQKAAPGTQSSIWRGVEEASRSLSVDSGTSNYQDLYEDRKVSKKVQVIEAQIRHIPNLNQDTVGVVVGVGLRIVSVDIFANPQLFRKMWPKIAKSSALSSVSDSQWGSISQQMAVDLLRDLHGKHYQQKSAIDLGFELSVSDYQVNANALVYKQAVVHLAVFTPKTIVQPWDDDCVNCRNPNYERRIPVMRR